MATIKPDFDQYTIDRLKVKLSNKIGYVIANKPDCAKLSESISKSGNGYISESTLYRLFFRSGSHRFYKSTYDILCQFIGYKDSLEFLEEVKEEQSSLHLNGIGTDINSSKTLLFYCVEHKAYHPLTDFFESTTEQSHQFKTSISVALFDSLQITNKQNYFFEEFADNQYIREYFFEKGHDPKFRIKNYDNAYLMYLKNIDKNQGIEQFQDYIFGNTILFRYYFLNNFYQDAFNIGNLIYDEFSSLENYQNEIYIFPFIRFTAYKLWFLELNEAKKETIKNYAYYLLDLCEKIKPSLEFLEQKILFHTIAETFINSSLPERFHFKLKDIYINEYERFPKKTFTKHLKYSLPYFEENGLLHYRP